MAEFTGERLIPGQVDVDLLNEHLARYAFAARLAHGKRVLDAGCGAGYGSAELAGQAASVTGADLAADAVDFARAHYGVPNLAFEQASCDRLPHRDGCFDLVVAFEVIEHLEGWREFLLEARRVLAPPNWRTNPWETRNGISVPAQCPARYPHGKHSNP